MHIINERSRRAQSYILYGLHTRGNALSIKRKERHVKQPSLNHIFSTNSID
jgi:hypothetical protein